MRFLKGGFRFLLVTVGIIVLTSFTIDATDTFNTSQTALSILMGSVAESTCPVGTVQIDLVDKSICMDVYENGVGEKCAVENPSADWETKLNIDRVTCQSVSKESVQPWTFVSFHQAKELCVKRNMRLPSALEWYEAGLGTPDNSACNTAGSSASVTGRYERCISSRGVHDMVGNVWEWVDEEVSDGIYQGRTMPESGFITEVDTAGVVLASTNTPEQMFNEDYFYGNQTGVRAMMRGGYYSGKDDAGLFSIHTKVLPSFSGNGTGFRCVKDL